MFIPHGTPLYENLATSYVLVDSLIADFCEGGFSGMVEVTLRRADAHILMVRGQIGAVVLARSGDTLEAPTEYVRTTVSEIAAAARLERGSVSIYRYSTEVAEIMAAPARAEVLYSQLSTEFADLEKVILKLRREGERQWLVKVATTSGLSALVHMRPERCLVLTARDGTLREPCESGDPMTNRDLRSLLDEARLMGGLFDVYFKGVNEPLIVPEVSADEDFVFLEAPPEVLIDHPGEPPPEISDAVREAKAVFDSLSLDDTAVAATAPISRDISSDVEITKEESPASSHAPQTTTDSAEPSPFEEPLLPLVMPAPSPAGAAPQESALLAFDKAEETGPMGAESFESHRSEEGSPAHAAEPAEDVLEFEPESEPSGVQEHTPEPLFEEVKSAHSIAGAGKYARRLSTDDLLLVPDDLRATGLLKRGSQADVLAEIKRLMSEMLRTVEESIRVAGDRESFAMRLRAGQLAVAERFPFLDPFGSEFEYLAGEIVFVGEAEPDDFIYGLGEALAQGIDIAAQSSPQPSRLRAHVKEGLLWLLDHQGADLKTYNLDHCVDAILADIQSHMETGQT
jgi:hypothetical protein